MALTTKEEKLQAFCKLLDIMDELREKCPWDKKQTFETLRPLTIEETYELTDAILENDLDEMKKELGDVLLHIIFYAKMGSEQQAFDIGSVIHSLNQKLVVRHPHIYGEVSVDNEDDVKRNWEQIKLKTGNKSVLSGVPKSLPALLKASTIQKKAAAVGFDWDTTEAVLDKIEEEFSELKNEIRAGNTANAEKEFGDVLFSLVNYARFLKINPENALEKTNIKFISRFNYVEENLKAQGKSFSESSLAEMDALWEEAKKQE